MVLVAQADSPLLICAGNGFSRRLINPAAGVDEDRYSSLVHPSVQVPDSWAVGEGSIRLAGVVLTASVTVGAEATLGMGAVLTRDLPPGETWAGVPARPLGAPGADVSAAVTSH